MLTRNPHGPLTRLIMAAAAIGLLMVGYYWGNQYKQGDTHPPSIEGVLIHPPPELPGFGLRDTQDQPFTGDSFDDRWTLLTFGDLSGAPGHLAITRMIEVFNRLAEDPELQARIQLALVAEVQDMALARDFGRLSPALKLLSGEPGEIRRLRASLGASPGTDPSEADASGLPLYLIGPSGRLLALFAGTQPPVSVAADLSAIAEHPEPYPAND